MLHSSGGVPLGVLLFTYVYILHTTMNCRMSNILHTTYCVRGSYVVGCSEYRCASTSHQMVKA